MVIISYGTRPEWLKCKPLIEELKNKNLPYKTLFTGQHIDLVKIESDFSIQIENLNKNRLNVILSECLIKISDIFESNKDIKYVIVQGDTSSAMAIALAAFNSGIKIIHLEAGLRTYDLQNPYPEEANRQLISRISDIHFCPTESNKNNLLNEGIKNNIFVVGNTGLDNLNSYRNQCEYNDKVLITLHRRENHKIIDKWFREINKLAQEYERIEFIAPIHPNPNVRSYSALLSAVKTIQPLDHKALLEILVKTKIVISDSGGIQEECSFFNKKIIVCRETTERSEVLNKTSFLCKNPESLFNLFKQLIHNYETNEICPYGDGYSSEKIVAILKKIVYL